MLYPPTTTQCVSALMLYLKICVQFVLLCIFRKMEGEKSLSALYCLGHCKGVCVTTSLLIPLVLN